MPSFFLPCTKDTELRSGNPAGNYGIYNTFLNGLSTTHRTLLYFNLGGISSSYTCDSATLTLVKSGVGAAHSFTLGVYAIAVGNNNWLEGTKAGATGGNGDSCWNYFNQTPGSEVSWAGSAGMMTAGTDYYGLGPTDDPLGTTSGNRSDAAGTTYSISLDVTTIQTMFGKGGANYGFLVVSTYYTSGISGRHGITAYSPKLTVICSGTAPSSAGAFLSLLL
jgi:hypothetical protein